MENAKSKVPNFFAFISALLHHQPYHNKHQIYWVPLQLCSCESHLPYNIGEFNKKYMYQLTILCLVSLSPDRRPSVILTVVNKEINTQWRSSKPKLYVMHINFSFYCSLANSKEDPPSPLYMVEVSQVSVHPGVSFAWLTQHSCGVWEAKRFCVILHWRLLQGYFV